MTTRPIRKIVEDLFINASMSAHRQFILACEPGGNRPIGLKEILEDERQRREDLARELSVAVRRDAENETLGDDVRIGRLALERFS